MLQALIHGKIDHWLVKNPWEIEDLLTAVVFGSCEYAGLDGWTFALNPFLAQAINQSDRKTARRLGDILPPVREVTHVTYEFWPPFGGFQRTIDGSESSILDSVTIAGASPELIISLTTNHKKRWFVLVEVKLNIGKSAGPSLEPQRITDQLAKYWEHLKKYANQKGGTALAIVYVTPWSFPYSEFEETKRELEKSGEVNAPIFWVSWRDFVSAVEKDTETFDLSPLIRDVCNLLRDRWGLVRTEIEPWPAALLLPSLLKIPFDVAWDLKIGGVDLAECWGQRKFVFLIDNWPQRQRWAVNDVTNRLWYFSGKETVQ